MQKVKIMRWMDIRAKEMPTTQHKREQASPMKALDASAEVGVLVVDDDAELCHSPVSRYLANEGFVVETVHTGSMGIERSSSVWRTCDWS